jgi:hypothetical protein
MNRMSAKLLIAYAHMRTGSPSLRSSPRQAVVRASFWLAPPSHQQAFRPPGVRDARCVRPTSATQSNCVHPYLVRSRPAIAAFAAWAPHGVFGSMRYCRGKGSFTPPASASVDRSGHNRLPRGLLGSASLVRSPRDDRLRRAWALSSHRAWNSIEPLTPLSPLPLPARLSHLRDSSLGRFRVIASEP